MQPSKQQLGRSKDEMKKETMGMMIAAKRKELGMTQPETDTAVMMLEQ